MTMTYYLMKGLLYWQLQDLIPKVEEEVGIVDECILVLSQVEETDMLNNMKTNLEHWTDLLVSVREDNIRHEIRGKYVWGKTSKYKYINFGRFIMSVQFPMWTH